MVGGSDTFETGAGVAGECACESVLYGAVGGATAGWCSISGALVALLTADDVVVAAVGEAGVVGDCISGCAGGAEEGGVGCLAGETEGDG